MYSQPKKRFGDDNSSDEEDGYASVFYRDNSKQPVKSQQTLSEVDHDDQNDDEDDTQSKSQSLAEPGEEFRVPYLQAMMLSCILEDCISQLRILAECNNQLRINKAMADMAILRAKKYEIKQPQFVSWDDLSGVNTKKLGCTQYKLDKLVADRKYVTDVLAETYLELSLNRCFNTLTASNKKIEDREVYKANLVEEEARNKTCRHELMKQLRQQRNHIKSVAYETDLTVDQLKSRVEDAALYSEIRGRYINNWQRARTEQHTQTIADKEAGPSDSINYYRTRTEQEQRIHSEVELLFNTFISETLSKVENWMNKYDKDMEEIDLKTTIMKNKYQDETSKRIEMEETYAHHEVLMKNWIQFKDDREKARLYREKMTKSAIVVQAWWRGLLVRLELGPFKPKKKPPPRPVGKKKK